MLSSRFVAMFYATNKRRRGFDLPRFAFVKSVAVYVFVENRRTGKSSARRRKCWSNQSAENWNIARLPELASAARRVEEDNFLAEEMREDAKEVAEHLMLVDLGETIWGASPNSARSKSKI